MKIIEFLTTFTLIKAIKDIKIILFCFNMIFYQRLYTKLLMNEIKTIFKNSPYPSKDQSYLGLGQSVFRSIFSKMGHIYQIKIKLPKLICHILFFTFIFIQLKNWSDQSSRVISPSLVLWNDACIQEPGTEWVHRIFKFTI